MIAHIDDAMLTAQPWASCGPVALAALLKRPLVELRHAFPHQEADRATWTSLPQMKAALTTLGEHWTPTLLSAEDEAARAAFADGFPVRVWPKRGLALIQWRGSWDRLDVGHPGQLRHTHWVAVLGASVFDVNAVGISALAGLGWWQPRATWERLMVPQIISYTLGATGGWWVRAGLEIGTP